MHKWICKVFLRAGTTQTLARTTKDLTETKTKLEAIDMDLKSK